MDKVHYPETDIEGLTLVAEAMRRGLKADGAPLPQVFVDMVEKLAANPLRPSDPINPNALGPIAMIFYEMGWSAREILARQKEGVNEPSRN